MPDAVASSRGARLKARFDVNGIQSSSSESSPAASGGGDMRRESPLGGPGATPVQPHAASLREVYRSGKDDEPDATHEPLVDGLVLHVAGDAGGRSAHRPRAVLPEREAHPGTDLHRRAEREVEPELDVRVLPAAVVHRARLTVGRGADVDLLVAGAETDPRIGRSVPEDVPVNLSAEAQRARRAADVRPAQRRIGGASEAIGE